MLELLQVAGERGEVGRFTLVIQFMGEGVFEFLQDPGQLVALAEFGVLI